MSRDIIWTSQFKRDYKLAMKRNKDMSFIDDCIRNTVTTTSVGIGQDTGSATFNPTGFWSTELKVTI